MTRITMQKTKTLSQLKRTLSQAQGESGTTAYTPKMPDEKKFVDLHSIEMIDDANGNGDEMFKGTGVKKIERKSERHGYDTPQDAITYKNVHRVRANEETEIEERTLDTGEMKKREDYVKGMKKSLGDFKARYGKDAKAVMYATATKMAKEEYEDDDLDVSLLEMFASLDEEDKSIMIEMLEEGIEQQILEAVLSEENHA